MTAELQSSRPKLGSAQQSIASLKSQIRSKKHSINRFQRERDGCIEELKAKRRRHRATQKRLALADAESASVKEEVESTKGALSLAIENFKESQERRMKFSRVDSSPTVSDMKMAEILSKNYIRTWI